MVAQWPNTTGPNKSKLYKIMVMAVTENGDMSKTIFKLGLCTDEDPDLTRSNLVEDADYWLIEHKVFAEQWFRQRDEEETEANCERTFSYVARVLSDLRRGRMSPDQLRCHVVGHAGSKHFPPTTAELWAKYITKSQASEAAMST